MLDWTLDLFFAKDLVQFSAPPPLGSRAAQTPQVLAAPPTNGARAQVLEAANSASNGASSKVKTP